MTVNTYDVGDRVTITGTYQQNGANADPSTVRGIFKGPSDTSATTYVYGTDPEITKSAVGIYTFAIPLDEKGYWYYRMDDGSGQYVATEGTLLVRDSDLV